MLVQCEHCEAVVDARPVAHYDYTQTKADPPGRFSLLLCPSCEAPILIDQQDYGDGLVDPYVLYPSPKTRVNPALPPPIRLAFSEALASRKAKAFTASTLMCRKTLEGICSEHGVLEKTLVASLKKLRDAGHIDDRLFEWADALRISGNEAAHDLSVTISREDADDVIEFTNALLEYVFTFREKFDKFKQRRAKKGGA